MCKAHAGALLSADLAEAEAADLVPSPGRELVRQPLQLAAVPLSGERDRPPLARLEDHLESQALDRAVPAHPDEEVVFLQHYPRHPVLDSGPVVLDIHLLLGGTTCLTLLVKYSLACFMRV